MLVRFNHGAAVWPTFTAFLGYRRRLAALAGIDLDQMDGFGVERGWSKVADYLRPLLSMPDGTGFVRAADCGHVSRRLRTLAELMPVDLADYELTLRLADALLEVARAGQAFRFVPRGARPRLSEHFTSVAPALVGFVTQGER